jgi:protein ImuA
VGFVIGEVAGNPRSLDFTASRRLTLAAQRHKVPLYLIRLDGERALSSARMRWDAKASPSMPCAWDTQAPGQAVWHAELFRARGPMPGQWLLREDAGALLAEKLLAEKPDVAPSGHASSGLGQMSLARHRPARKAIVADNDTSLVSWARGLQHRYATSKAAGR